MTVYAEAELPTVTISPDGSGEVSFSTSGSDMIPMADITATPAAGYRFVEWTFDEEDLTSSIPDNPWHVALRPFTNGTYTNLTAVFEPTTTPVSGISLDHSAVSLSVGGTETLTATVSPDGATDKTVTWSSSDTAVATVENGVVTAAAEGTANIIATATNGTDDTSDDKTATCVVTVASAATPISYITTSADPYNTGAYYATFYDSTKSYVADCEVYYATANADGRFTLEKAEGNVIKAGEGVILKATSETVTLTQTDAAASYDSLLTGSDTETTVENALVLSLGKNGVWFYKYSGTLGANKAYYLAQ